jgi:hypothetical protein
MFDPAGLDPGGSPAGKGGLGTSPGPTRRRCNSEVGLAIPVSPRPPGKMRGPVAVRPKVGRTVLSPPVTDRTVGRRGEDTRALPFRSGPERATSRRAARGRGQGRARLPSTFVRQAQPLRPEDRSRSVAGRADCPQSAALGPPSRPWRGEDTDALPPTRPQSEGRVPRGPALIPDGPARTTHRG